MVAQTQVPVATIRNATKQDIPAIVSLILTSFRQFDLFNYIYKPLEHSKDTAKDTIFFWCRRLLITLLDPSYIVQVAELPESVVPALASPTEQDASVDRESWQMLQWVQNESRLSQKSTVTPLSVVVIVGFAIWQDRPGAFASATEKADIPTPGWINKWRIRLVNLELGFRSMMFQRKDQDAHRRSEYEEAEEELEKEFYPERCFYLDNLCVDFRYQRLGIGQLLLQPGVDIAHQRGLVLGTEASAKGLGLYEKVGFETVGMWRVGPFKIPVMKLQPR